MRYARRRDDCEPAIIAAVRAAGRAVQQNSGDGEPDLTVSSPTEMLYLECKDVPKGHGHRRAHKGKHDDPDPSYRELTPRQVKWWRAWKEAGGKPPVIVHDAAEALAAIGAVTHNRAASDLPAELLPDAVALHYQRRPKIGGT